MDARDQLEAILASARDRVKKDVDRAMSGFAARGLFQSGPAIGGCVESWLKATEDYLMDALRAIAESSPTAKEWEGVRQAALQFVEDQAGSLLRYCARTWGDRHQLAVQSQRERIELLKAEILARAEAYIKGRMHLAESVSLNGLRKGVNSVAKRATIFNVLIASPSDVAEDRDLICDVIHDWNTVNAVDLGVVLLPVRWETDSIPTMGDRPQAIINDQLVRNCDILVGVFWTRIGSRTGVAESGTVEEIEEFKKMGKPVMLYFSSVPVVPTSIDMEQYERLKAFKKSCEAEGIVRNYESLDALKEQLYRDLTRIARKLVADSVGLTGQNSNVSSVSPSLRGEPEGLLVKSKQEADTVLRRLHAEWTAEKGSEPHDLAEGKRILKKLGDVLLDLRTFLVGRADDSVVWTLDRIAKKTRSAQRHELYLDGGASYERFWTQGDDLFYEALKILRTL